MFCLVAGTRTKEIVTLINVSLFEFFVLAPDGAAVNSQGRKSLEIFPNRSSPGWGGSTVAPSGAQIVYETVQGLTSLAIDCRPYQGWEQNADQAPAIHRLVQKRNFKTYSSGFD